MHFFPSNVHGSTILQVPYYTTVQCMLHPYVSCEGGMKRREPHFECGNAVNLQNKQRNNETSDEDKTEDPFLDIHSELNPLTVYKKTSNERTTSLQGTNGCPQCVPFVWRFYYTKVLLLRYVHYAINKFLVRVDVQCFL